MKMNRYAASALTFLCLQSLCFVSGASSLPMKNLISTAGLIGQNRNPGLEGEGGTKDVTFPRPTLANYVAGLTNRNDRLFGISARISAWGHEHIKSDAYSAAVIQVSNAQGGSYNAIRAGLHTFPSLYNDSKLHLFVQWTADRDWKTGCYNTDCPGFVPSKDDGFEFPGKLRPGMVVEELSSYGHTDSTIDLQIVKDERPRVGGDWWLYHLDGPVLYAIGHWPASLFTTLSRHATEAAWYGPREGPVRSAYFADISLMDNKAEAVEDPSLASVTAMLNAERCYQVAMDAGGSNTFFYGGPVSNSCV